MPNIYQEVKGLFKISDKSFDVYYYLKHTMLYGSGDILFVYETTREAEKEFWEYVARYRGVIYNTERRKIVFPGDENIYFKSINECKKKLEGYRFKEIQFRGDEN